MLAMFLLLQVEDAVIRVAREKTAASVHCVVDPQATDITVCGMRNADRFRVPFATHAVRHVDDVRGQRAELLHARTPMEEMGPFLIGGGAAGVKTSVSFGPGEGSGATSVGGLRRLAP